MSHLEYNMGLLGEALRYQPGALPLDHGSVLPSLLERRFG